MRIFLLAVALVIAVLGCSDGKLNLLIVFWGDNEESSSSRERPSSSSAEKPSSSSIIIVISSSSIVINNSSSGNEELPPISSSSSSSSISSLNSSSSRTRSSSSKTDSNGYTYADYPTLEEGAKDVKPGWASRYWDGCKPHCSWLVHNVNIQNPKPWNGICKNCDKNNKEISTYYKDPNWTDGLWWASYLSVPSAYDSPNGAYACWDMTPFVVNDTLAYGFAAMNPEIAECGACYQLQFDGNWYDEPKQPRPTHVALKGKTMIIMASNIGTDVKHNAEMKDGRIGTQFDIMFPGGGAGQFDCISKQLGIRKEDWVMGVEDPTYGGLFQNCLFDGMNMVLGLSGENAIRDGSHRARLQDWQDCIRKQCNKFFGNNKQLLNGCLWSADWLMAADNPTLYYKKVECPRYLIDKYYSTIDTVPPPMPNPLPNNGLFMIEGSIDYKQTGWYD